MKHSVKDDRMKNNEVGSEDLRVITISKDGDKSSVRSAVTREFPVTIIVNDSYRFSVV